MNKGPLVNAVVLARELSQGERIASFIASILPIVDTSVRSDSDFNSTDIEVRVYSDDWSVKCLFSRSRESAAAHGLSLYDHSLDSEWVYIHNSCTQRNMGAVHAADFSEVVFNENMDGQNLVAYQAPAKYCNIGKIEMSCDKTGYACFVAIDIVSVLNRALGTIRFGGSRFIDWSEYYESGIGNISTNIPFLEIFIRELFAQKVPSIQVATKGRIFITGDTDSSTNCHLHKYLDLGEQFKANPCVIFRQFDCYDKNIFQRIRLNGYSTGIHPYSNNGSETEYVADFDRLVYESTAIFECQPVAFRNHKFQFISRQFSWAQASRHGIPFDLNVCCGGGKTYIGNSHGLSVPLQACIGQEMLPVWLMATTLEDDIYLLDMDYCRGGPRHDKEHEVLDFLTSWVLHNGRDAVINMHPEHVELDGGWLFKVILRWADEHRVPMPDLSLLKAPLFPKN